MPSTPETLFAKAARDGASDIHIVTGSPIIFRIDGELVPQTRQAVTAAAAEGFVKAILTREAFVRFKEEREIDVSYDLTNGPRLRVNCHFERGRMGLAARVIPTDIPTLEEIDLKGVGEDLCAFDNGLILFTGPTGSGKSTSLAAMIQHINNERGVNVVTLEDPIEFLFSAGKGVIRQRQFGEDFHSFAEALKRVLRQDPNIIMVGEMRDLETIAATLTLGETGHLVFGTLHTPDAAQAISRIVDVFPPHQQNQIRSQLSLTLRAVVGQRLVPHIEGGRIANREILINTPAVGNIIRENRVQEIKSVLQTGGKYGMCTFEQDAKRLLNDEVISKEVYEYCVH